MNQKETAKQVVWEVTWITPTNFTHQMLGGYTDKGQAKKKIFSAEGTARMFLDEVAAASTLLGVEVHPLCSKIEID